MKCPAFLTYEDVLAAALLAGSAAAGVKVQGTAVKTGKQKKIMVFKYKAKKNYRRRQGHRQPYTKVTIDKIEA